MKARLEATPEELAERGDELLYALAKAARPHAPKMADALEQAANDAECEEMHEPRFQVLRDLLAWERKRYERMLSDMLDEIGEALDARADELSGE